MSLVLLNLIWTMYILKTAVFVRFDRIMRVTFIFTATIGTIDKMFIEFIEVVTLVVRLDDMGDSGDGNFASDGAVLVFDDERVVVVVDVVGLRLLMLVFDVQVRLADLQRRLLFFNPQVVQCLDAFVQVACLVC